MTLLEVKNLDSNELNLVTEVLKEMVEECFEVDFDDDKETLEDIYQKEVTEEHFEQISNLILEKEDEWTYFDVMEILKL